MDALSSRGALEVERVVEDDERCALFVLTGDIDETVAPRLLEQLMESARRSQVDLVIIDLIRVDYCGAAGVKCLEAAHRAAGRHGTELALTRPSQFVRRVLTISGLTHLLAE
ncbi:STAS domain-containing protein [Cryptosporangium sp. NPDC051539]|uniref:STAS domain-containing protein n=1 Tax=Cryptosporangium sp. NPDC051539 TaxID=3363962 RepID=UPI0037894DB8